MAESLTSALALKERLPHTWDALFARFGRFTDIQEQAIAPLLEGRNCILVSATASGKTEAAIAPLIERHVRLLSRGRLERSHIAILYIVPSRALARDVARRLQRPLEQLGISNRVKTGDDPALDSSRMPELLVTTPESLDALLANRPRLLKDVAAVVLDEIHLLDNTPRGDQLRIVLNRLRRIKSFAFERGETATAALQFAALSATVADPAETAGRYFSNPAPIKADATRSHRALDAELAPMDAMDGSGALDRLFAGLREKGHRKLLVFASERSECERWTEHYRTGSPFGDRVFVHHAGLDARVRRDVERDFAAADAAVCFATSTLELGVDIGSVDLVVLIGPPDDTSAFLQRIGRGSRRAACTTAVCLYRNDLERALFQVFIRAANAGEIEPSAYSFRPSVIAQQLFSYVKQTRLGEIVPESAYELFSAPDGSPLIAREWLDRIVQHLVEEGYFTAHREATLRPGPRWQELYDKRAIYSNIKDSSEAATVVDSLTSKKLGQIRWGIRSGMTFSLGGHTLQATHVDRRRMLVRAKPHGTSDGAPDETSLRSGARRTPGPALTRAAAVELGMPGADAPDRMTMTRIESDETETAEYCLFHFTGDAFGLALGDMLESQHNVRVQHRDGFSLILAGELPPDGPFRFDVMDLRKCLIRRWRQIERWHDLGCFQHLLPIEERRQSAIDAFNVEEFLRVVASRPIAWAPAAPLEAQVRGPSLPAGAVSQETR